MLISLTVDNEKGSAAFHPLKENAVEFANYLRGLSSGAQKGSVRLNTGVAASKAITCAFAAATVGDVLRIGGVDITAVASAPAADEFLIGSSNAAMATNLAAAINASVPYVKAVASGAVVTVYSRHAGTIGNLIGVVATVDAGTPFAFSGAVLAGGTDRISLLSR